MKNLSNQESCSPLEKRGNSGDEFNGQLFIWYNINQNGGIGLFEEKYVITDDIGVFEGTGISIMRVIAGKAKGHQLKVPKVTAVRPATDLVRGAIFSILETMVSDWSLVLDLFAGSGALGIEALSRGAGWVDFVDQKPRCCDIIRQNLEKTKLAAQAHVSCCSVAKAISFLDKEYNIIIMDPPYSNSSIGSLITRLATSKLVGTNSVLVVTHSPRLHLDSSYAPLYLIKERRHGDSCIAVYQKEGKP